MQAIKFHPHSGPGEIDKTFCLSQPTLSMVPLYLREESGNGGVEGNEKDGGTQFEQRDIKVVFDGVGNRRI